MVPMVVSTTESKSSKSTAPGTELVVAPGLMVTEMAFAGVTASTHPAAASAALSFDFIIQPLSTTAAATSMACTEFFRQFVGGVIFWTNDVADLATKLT